MARSDSEARVRRSTATLHQSQRKSTLWSVRRLSIVVLFVLLLLFVVVDGMNEQTPPVVPIALDAHHATAAKASSTTEERFCATCGVKGPPGTR